MELKFWDVVMTVLLWALVWRILSEGRTSARQPRLARSAAGCVMAGLGLQILVLLKPDLALVLPLGVGLVFLGIGVFALREISFWWYLHRNTLAMMRNRRNKNEGPWKK